MFNKVMIANRGAIAVRIIKTLKKMGISSVAVYAEADVDSLHVSLADEAWSLGEGIAAQTYLDQQKLFDILQKSGAQAVHPGYGFLSENADFCRALTENNIAFIGPTPEQMIAFGLKHEARRLAQECGVPLLPGTSLLSSVDEAAEQAEKIGYPVMLKSTAGGGGIGMQICRNPEQLRASWQGIKRLSANNFANEGVFLEKYVERARHIEVQVFGDGKGEVVVLGDRDCSTQRRHQKVIEEAPAPNIPPHVRQQLHDSASRLASYVHYRSAGTVEFIYDSVTHQFYFLEVNTRLQVEHGVTEMIYGVDLVEWMIRTAAGEMEPLNHVRKNLQPKGHAIQARIYAENPARDFQPSAGTLNVVRWPEAETGKLRVDHWVGSGSVISPLYDPMLGKIIAWADTRKNAIERLNAALEKTVLEGIVTNSAYIGAILKTDALLRGEIHTRYLNDFSYVPQSCDVLSPGTLTTIQDYPGRRGYWDVGVPPSGPFDDLAFRLGNRLLGNPEDAAGLEITFNGPTLKFNSHQRLVLTGAEMEASLDGEPVAFYEVFSVKPGQVLKIGKIKGVGSRAYCLFSGGILCENYLGSKSTFTLGQFGGITGNALRTGDVLSFDFAQDAAITKLPEQLRPQLSNHWQLRVIYGPHGAPDFFTPKDIDTFFASHWRVHYNSSRTGVRLIGPKPEWARSDGGEAGMHPSNIHDNAYAVGSIDFTGDMPVILGPDGPSLGGFVCPATVIAADLWKLGQLRAGDTIQFIPVSIDDAAQLLAERQQALQLLENKIAWDREIARAELQSPILRTLQKNPEDEPVVYRPSGECHLLVEYGSLRLDLVLRFRAHTLMLWLQEQCKKNGLLQDAIIDLTPGVRSLQIHYDPLLLPLNELLDLLERAEDELQNIKTTRVPSRIVHLPLSWDDQACRLAIEKYRQSVRKDAPWCPSNIEFIRRINGLDSIEEVKKIVFDASYVVMGLGDVYLGAPVATPLDPRHRLVTTKYNPARTWTAENSVGIGGSYMCIYGMEGPGGYQFVGRTLQMWNRYRQTEEFTKPWLLRFFDQIRFYEVSAEELAQIRRDFPLGRHHVKIEQTYFDLEEYQAFLAREQKSIDAFVKTRNVAFEEELQRWVESGQMHYESQSADEDAAEHGELEQGAIAVESPVAGNIWQVLVKPGDKISAGDIVCVLESMKMEIEIPSPESGIVKAVKRQQGQSVAAGQAIAVLEMA
jgi:urea carboxylase